MSLIIRIAIIFLLTKASLSAQDSFSKYYTFESTGSTFRSMIIERDTILLQGYFLDKDSPFLQGMVFAKVDSFGNLVSFKKYFDMNGRDYTYNPLNNLIKLTDGRFLTLSMTLQDNALQMCFLKSNFELDTILEFLTNDQTVQLNWWRNVIEISDGYLVFGSAQRLNFSLDIQILKINKAGKLIWRKWLGLNNKDEIAGDVSRYSDSSYVIASYRKPTSVPTSDIRKNIWILEVDTSGSIINEYIDPDPFSGASGGLVIDSNKNIFFSGSSICQDIFGNYNTLGRIGKLGNDFKLHWKQVFGKNYNPMTGFADMINSGGFLLASGIYVDSSRNIFDNPSNYTSGWIAIASIDGDSICQKIDTAQWFLTDGTAMGIYRVIDTLSSGNLITCGDGTFGPQEGTHHEFAWIVKSKHPPCENIVVDIEEVSNFHSIIYGYPNPSSGNIEIHLTGLQRNHGINLQLFSLLGQEVTQYMIEGNEESINLDTNDIPNGIYFLKAYSAGSLIAAPFKIVVSN